MGLFKHADIEGFPEVYRKLQQVAGPGSRRVAMKILVKWAKPVRDAIRAETPIGAKARPTQGDRPGNLRRSVRYKAARKRTGVIAYIVGPFGRGSAHRHLVIGGHKIRGHSRIHVGKRVSDAGLVSYSKNSYMLGRKGTSGATRTRPNPFVQAGYDRSKGTLGVVESAAREAFPEFVRG